MSADLHNFIISELAGVLPEFFNETEWPVILEVETPRLKNAEVLKSYFRSLQGE